MNMYPKSKPQVYRTALIDADIIAWQVANTADRIGMDHLEITERIDGMINQWIQRAFASSSIICLTERGKQNFRLKVWPKYKANRKSKPKPPEIGFIYEYLHEEYEVFSRPIFEADDGMGILATLGTVPGPVIVSIDKDMRTIPGWHFNPMKEDFPVLVSYDQAEYQFHLQWLMGDSTDNYPGIPRVGPKKAEALLGGPAMYTAHTLHAYEEAGLTYEYCLQMARCARILTAEWWDKETKTPILWEPGHIPENLEEWAQTAQIA